MATTENDDNIEGTSNGVSTVHQVQHDPHHVHYAEIQPQHTGEQENYPPDHSPSGSFFQRSIHAVAELFHPFSAGALATLPRLSRPLRYYRRDAVPEAEPDEEGNLPTVRDYHAINSLPSQVRVPKKVATPVKVEAKVWFANERTWIAWMDNAILLGTLALALFNASRDEIAKRFAYTYALISIGIMIYAYVLYQHRITMILRRDPGHFDVHIGPIIVTAALFTAVLANFILRVREMHKAGTPFPGTGFFFSDPTPPPTFVIQGS